MGAASLCTAGADTGADPQELQAGVHASQASESHPPRFLKSLLNKR